MDRISNRIIGQLKIPINYTGIDQLTYIETTTYYEISQKVTYIVEVNEFKLKEQPQGLKNIKQLSICQQQLQNKFYMFEITSQGGNVYIFETKNQKLNKIYTIPQINNQLSYSMYILDDKNICIVQENSYYALKINLDKNTCEQIRLPFIASSQTCFYPVNNNKVLVAEKQGLFIYNIDLNTKQLLLKEDFSGCEPYYLFQDLQIFITSFQGRLYNLDISSLSSKEFCDKLKKKNLKLNKNIESELSFKPIININNQIDLYTKELQAQIEQYDKERVISSNDLQLIRFCQRILTINQYKDKPKQMYEELANLYQYGKDIDNELDFQMSCDIYVNVLKEYQEKAKQVDQYRKELEKQMNKELRLYKKKKEQEYQEKKAKLEPKQKKEEPKKEEKQPEKQQEQQRQRQQTQQPQHKKQEQKKTLQEQREEELERYKEIQQEEIERSKRAQQEQKLRRERLEKRKNELYVNSKQQNNKKLAIIHKFNLFTQGPAYCTILDNRRALVRQGNYLCIFNFLIYQVECAKTMPVIYQGQPCQYVRKEKRFYEYYNGLTYLDIREIKCCDQIVINDIVQQDLNQNEEFPQIIDNSYKTSSYVYYQKDNCILFVCEKDDQYLLSTLNLNNFTLKSQEFKESIKVMKDGKQCLVIMKNKAYLVKNSNDLLTNEIELKPQYEATQILHLNQAQVQILDNKITMDDKNVYVALSTIDSCKVAIVQNILMFVDDGGVFTTVIINESQSREVSMTGQ